MANVYAAQNDMRRAIVHYREAVRLRPAYGEAWHNLGAACLMLGDVDQAIRYFQEAQRIQPENEQWRASLEQALARQQKGS